VVVQTKVQKWGNSLGICLQKGIAEQLLLEKGSEVRLEVVGDKLVISPVAPRYSLKNLVDQIDESNIHKEIGAGGPSGAEIW